MNVLTIHLTCPRCAGHLLHEGFEPEIASPDLGWIDCRCDFCLDVYRITVTAKVIEPWPVDKLDRERAHIEAGTYAADVLEGTAFR